MADKKKRGEVIRLGVGSAAVEDRFNEGFVPSPRMEAARGVVRQFVDEGLAGPLDWLRAIREHSEATGTVPEMTSDEWRDWQSVEGFVPWWYKDLYPEMSINVLRGYAPEFIAGVRTALAKGEPRMLVWFYEKILSAEGSGNDSVLSEILSGARKNPWKSKDTDTAPDVTKPDPE